MHYTVISFTHKNCDLSTRERLALDSDDKKEIFLKEITQNSFINEALVLSTCNRVEIIVNTRDHMRACELIFDRVAHYSKVDIAELEGRAEVYEDNGAIHHIFSVVSSLDSLVVGETQIVGQLKDAFKFSLDRGFCSQKLSRVAHFAFKCSADVRNKTGISKNPVSVASAAVSYAEEIFGSLQDKKALIIGAGEMSILAAKHLVTKGCSVVMANRDVGKIKELADGMEGDISVESLGNLKSAINTYNILFTATSAPHYIITKDMVERCTFGRYWFDLAVPKDIEPMSVCENLKIIEVDDLKDIVSKNRAFREEQAKEAYKIVGTYTYEFYKWLKTLSIDPIIKSVRKNAKESSLKELDRAISKGYIPKEYEDEVKKIIHASFNSFLHTPTAVLKDISQEPHADMVIESLKILFEIDDDIGREFKMLNKYKCEEHINGKGK